MRTSVIARVLANTDRMPSLPPVVSKLIQLLSDEDVTLDQLVSQIKSDPVLTARVIALANAGAYGKQGISLLEQAVPMLGFNRLRDIAINNAMLEVFALDTPERLGSLWLESVAVAVCAEEMARRTGENPSIAYITGLLHGIGKLLLYSIFREEYLDLLTLWERSNGALHEIEVSLLGVDHVRVGYELARSWRLPDVIAEAILGQTQASEEEAEYMGMASVIHYGSVLAHALDLAQVPDNRVPSLSAPSLLRMGIHWPEATELFARIEGRFLYICNLIDSDKVRLVHGRASPKPMQDALREGVCVDPQ